MKKTIKIKWILIVLGCLIVIYLPFKLLLSIENSNLNWSKASIPEYNRLFNSRSTDKLNIPTTIINKNQEPVSNYIYDQKFDLMVYKVILSKNLSLKNIINIKNGGSNNNNGMTYLNMSSDNYKMYKGINSIGRVSSLNIKVIGDSSKCVFKDDSLFCYYYKVKSFSIAYNNPYDIVMNSEGPNISLNTAFIKKGNIMYIIIMTAGTGKEEMLPDQLYTIIR